MEPWWNPGGTLVEPWWGSWNGRRRRDKDGGSAKTGRPALTCEERLGKGRLAEAGTPTSEQVCHQDTNGLRQIIPLSAAVLRAKHQRKRALAIQLRSGQAARKGLCAHRQLHALLTHAAIGTFLAIRRRERAACPAGAVAMCRKHLSKANGNRRGAL